METFYKGDEIKFAINYEAPGFSMDEDDFDIEVKVGTSGVKGSKNSTSESSTDIIVFKEDGEDQSSVWYAIVDTKSLPVGTMRVVITGHIVDANANDGVRDDIAVAALGKLVNP